MHTRTITAFAVKKVLPTLATTGLALALLAGCVSQPTAPQPSGGAPKASCPVTTDESFTGTVRIAYQAIPNADLLVKNNGLLAACLPKATIKWSQFSSGGDVVQAFGSNSLDLGLAGSSPSTKAVSAPLNLPVQIVWAHDIIGTAESLVTRDAGATSITQLKGKTIAVAYGSTSHFSLLNALSQAGMKETDVKLINLDPEKMPAAWQRKQIDAAWVWDPVLSKLLADGGKTVTSSAVTAKAGAPTFDMELASDAFIKANPNVMKTWTAVQDYAVKQIESDPEKSATAIASQLGIKAADVQKQFKGYTYPDAAAQAKLFHNELPGVLKSTAGFLKTQSGVDAAKPDYTPYIYTTAIDAVAGK